MDWLTCKEDSIRARMAVIGLVVLTLGGCSKNGDDVTGGGGGGTIVAAGANFINSGFASTILRCDLLLDGTVIATETYAIPTAGCAPVGTATIGNGNHSLSFRITDQSTSPNEYETIGTTVQSATASKSLGDKRQTLSTGQSISFTFAWP